MHVAVLGSGLAGLTAAGLLARKGHRVSLYEQHPEIGGVTSGIAKEGFHWDLGQMLIPDLGAGEPGRSVLEELGDRLVCYAERYLPGLSEHTVTRVVYTPEDFRRRTALGVHAFGGSPPRVDRTPARHRTPIRGLWFVGGQSEVYGGVTGAMTSASKTVKIISRRRPF